MSPTRRTFLTGSGAALAAALAGCLGGPLASFAASPATVPARTLRRTGYEEQSVDERVITQGFGPAGRVVEVRNWIATYHRPLSPSLLDSVTEPVAGDAGDGPVAVFSALSTPEVEVAGQEFNPVANFSPNDVVERVQDFYEGIREVERVGERAVAALDTAVRVVEYRAVGRVGGAEIEGLTDLSLHVTDPIAHEGDFVVVVAAHPAVSPIEPSTVDTLLSNVEHPTG